jgi:flagellar hook-associated protein 3 FlgL
MSTTVHRVTQHSIAERSLRGLQGNLTAMGRLQEQLSSGKQILRPSDNPTGTSSAMQLRGEVRRNEQWSRNADDGIGWLGTIDSTLQGMLPQVNKARELVLQGLSTGAQNDQSRAAMAVEVDQLRESLLAAANTKYLGRPVFGGTTAGGTAYDTAGAYQGDTGQVRRTVGDGVSVRVDLTGTEAFGPAGADVFSTLAQISDHLRNDPSALSADLTRLDTLSAGLRTSLGAVGARYNRLDVSRSAADGRVGDLSASLSDVENIDLPDTIMRLQLANTAYQAALGATAKVIQPSLMDFLR